MKHTTSIFSLVWKQCWNEHSRARQFTDDFIVTLPRRVAKFVGNWVLRYEVANYVGVRQSNCELWNVVVNCGATNLHKFASLVELLEAHHDFWTRRFMEYFNGKLNSYSTHLKKQVLEVNSVTSRLLLKLISEQLTSGTIEYFDFEE